MTLNWTWIGVFLVGLILLFRYGRRFTSIRDSHLPFELRRAELAYAEHTFQTDDKPRLRARVDRVYRMSNGTYVLLELKSRRRKVAYSSDIIELSAQRVALMAQEGVPVALHGYVLAQDANGRFIGAVRVDLLNEQQVYALMKRQSAVLADPEVAVANGFPRLCASCEHASRCMSAHPRG